VANKTPLKWVSDTITGKFDKSQQAAYQYLSKTTTYFSLRSETYAKSKAKWTDRSGNARGGLNGSYEARIGSGTASFTIEIAHRMSYGIWLEIRFGQKYAIINKTIEVQGKQFFETANKLMAKMFGGS